MIAAIYARKSTDQHRRIPARAVGGVVVVTAIGYVRRSKESRARTVSLEDQRARIAEYAQGQGWQVAEIVADDGVSGGRRERLERLAERVRVTGARVIIVYHVDRVP